MIDPKELRIGSLVQNGSGLILTVSKITAEWFLAHFEDFLYLSKHFDLSPIPLTPEILKRVGFKKRGYFWKHPNCPIIQAWEFEGKINLGIKGHENIRPKAEFHILQNLFFDFGSGEITLLSSPQQSDCAS